MAQRTTAASISRGAGGPGGAATARPNGDSRLAPIIKFCRRQPLGAIGGVLFALMVLTALLAPQLAPYGPKAADFAPYTPPGAEFPMGTDHLGRDILSRVIWGARLSLYVGILSVGIGVTLGALWGVVTAYFGGVADMLSQRIVDSVMAFPAIVLAVALMAVLGQSVDNVVVALGFIFIPISARIMRSTTLSIKESMYVESARAIGGSHIQVIRRHVIPNSIAPYIVLDQRQSGLRHRGRGVAQLSRPRGAAGRTLLGRHADAGRRFHALGPVDVAVSGSGHHPGGVWHEHAWRRAQRRPRSRACEARRKNKNRSMIGVEHAVLWIMHSHHLPGRAGILDCDGAGPTPVGRRAQLV